MIVSSKLFPNIIQKLSKRPRHSFGCRESRYVVVTTKIVSSLTVETAPVKMIRLEMIYSESSNKEVLHIIHNYAHADSELRSKNL